MYLIDLIMIDDENAVVCEIACDCVKRANVVVALRKEKFAKTHRYPQADICSTPYSDHDDTHTPDNRLWSP